MNTLRYAKKLEEVGFSREQADMTIGILNEVVEDNLATKQDLKDLSIATSQDFVSVRQEIASLKNDLQQEIRNLSNNMNQEFVTVRFEMQQMKSDLVIKLGAMMVTGIAVISALIKLF